SGEMEHDRALEAFELAASLAPDNPNLHSNLAYTLILKGDFDRAEQELREALRLDPAMGAAYQNLTWIRKAKKDDPIIAELETLKAKGHSSRETYAQYLFALGKCYDDIGEWDLAFENYRLGNETAETPYHPGVYDKYVAAVKTIWTRDFIDERAAFGLRSGKPVFIVGMPRSGSSLLEHKLANHASIAALGERPDIDRISKAVQRNHPTSAKYPEWARDVPVESYGGFAKIYLDKFNAMFPDAVKFVDKNLLNFHYLGLIRAMMPDAIILESRRNPVDTCVSCYFQNLRSGHNFKFRLDSLGHYYGCYVELMKHWSGVIDGVTPVVYEEFVQAPDEKLGEVLALLGVSEDGASSGEGARHIQTSSAYQARQPVNTESLGRWRHYEKHLGPLLAALDKAGVAY
ncbi:MAG: sulfotransferase, partial [Parvularculaceae bacterium]